MCKKCTAEKVKFSHSPVPVIFFLPFPRVSHMHLRFLKMGRFCTPSSAYLWRLLSLQKCPKITQRYRVPCLKRTTMTTSQWHQVFRGTKHGLYVKCRSLRHHSTTIVPQSCRDRDLDVGLFQLTFSLFKISMAFSASGYFDSMNFHSLFVPLLMAIRVSP